MTPKLLQNCSNTIKNSSQIHPGSLPGTLRRKSTTTLLQKAVKRGLKWAKRCPDGHKGPPMGPKWTQRAPNAPKGGKMDPSGPKMGPMHKLSLSFLGGCRSAIFYLSKNDDAGRIFNFQSIGSRTLAATPIVPENMPTKMQNICEHVRKLRNLTQSPSK